MPLRPPAFFGEQKIALTLGRARRPRIDPAGTKLTLGGRARGRLGRAAARDRRRAGPAAAARRRPAARADAAHAGRQPRHHRPRRRAPAARSSWAPASSAWRWRRRCARAASRSTSSRPRRCRSSARWAPSWAASCAASTRSTASASTSAQTVDRDRARRRHAVGRRRGVTADLVVLGVGVRPSFELAKAAGLTIDRGVVVDDRLRDQRRRRVRGRRRRPLPLRADRRAGAHRALGRRAADGAGRGAQHPGRRSAVHGAAVLLDARNTTSRCRTSATPRAGTASTSHGDLAARDATLAYRRGGQTLAVATLGRDRTSLEAEVAIEARRPGDAGRVRSHPLAAWYRDWRPIVRSRAVIVGSRVAVVGGGRDGVRRRRRCSRIFAAYWIAGKARWLGLDPYVNHAGSAVAPAPVGRRRRSSATAGSSTRRWRRSCSGRWRSLPYRVAKLAVHAALLAALAADRAAAGSATGRSPRGRGRRAIGRRAVLPALPPPRARADRPAACCRWCSGLAAARARLSLAGGGAGAGGDVQAGAARRCCRCWSRSAAGAGRLATLACCGVAAACRPRRSARRALPRVRHRRVCRAPRSTAKGAPRRCCSRARASARRGSAQRRRRNRSTSTAGTYQTATGRRPAAASLPRLLAPEAPSRASVAGPIPARRCGAA